MRITYISIQREVDIAIDKARAARRTIQKIELSPDEWTEFRLELEDGWPKGAFKKGEIPYRGVIVCMYAPD